MAHPIIQQLIDRIFRFWLPLSVREKRALVFLGFLCFFLFYLWVLILPAQKSIHDLQQQLSDKRQNLADIESMAHGLLHQQRQQQAIIHDPQQINDLIVKISQKHGLTSLQINHEDQGAHPRWQLVGKKIVFSDWIAMLQDLREQTLLQIKEVSAMRVLEPGQVNVTAELESP